MDRGLYIAASGMLAEMARQDLLANDLANATTPGYKADRASQHSFGEMMLANSRTGQAVGPIGTGSAIVAQNTDLTGAPLRDTGEPLDFAIEGVGFFAVQTPQGVRYTRNGSFQADSNGRLVDQLGNAVLGPKNRPVTVKNDGTVDGGQIGVFAVNAPRKVGDGYFTGAANGQSIAQVRSGALEGSGVDPARAMVDMMASLRAFEAGQKVLTTIDASLEKAASQVGRTS
jgi:flagellar basal-body rod protein FlgF